MQVILMEKVDNLGGHGEEVTVKPGYGRNFLIPTGKAVTATKENRAVYEARRAELEQDAVQTLASAQARRDTLAGLKLTIASKAGDEGKLFGSVGTVDIAQAISDAGAAVEKKEIRLPQGAIRHIGEYPVELHLHPDVNVEITIEVVPEA